MSNGVAAAAIGDDRGTWRSRALLPVLVCAVAVQALVSSLGAPLVPLIAHEYDVTLGTAQWALTASLLVGAVATPLLGRMADLGWERTVLLGGIALVLLGGLLALLPGGIASLLAGRALQGVGLALTPVAMAIARVHLSQEALAGAIGALSVAVVTGSALSHPVVTAVAQAWGLHAAIWSAVLVTAVVLVVALVVVPGDRGAGAIAGNPAGRRIDWWGAVLLGVATSGALLVIAEGADWGWLSPAVLGLLAAVLVAGCCWVGHSLRAAAPLVDLRLAARRSTAGAHVAAVVMGAGVFYLLGLVIVLLQADPRGGPGLGQPVLAAGLVLVPYALMSVVGSRMITGWVAGTARQELWLPVGGLFFLAATGCLALFHDHAWQVLAAMLLAGTGSGCTFKALPGLIVRAVPPRETGSALAFNTVLRYLGFSVGSALVVVVIELRSPAGVELSTGAYAAALQVAALLWLVAIATTLLTVRRPTPAWDTSRRQ